MTPSVHRDVDADAPVTGTAIDAATAAAAAAAIPLSFPRIRVFPSARPVDPTRSTYAK
jgi:hypothetical protein